MSAFLSHAHWAFDGGGDEADPGRAWTLVRKGELRARGRQVKYPSGAEDYVIAGEEFRTSKPASVPLATLREPAWLSRLALDPDSRGLRDVAWPISTRDRAELASGA